MISIINPQKHCIKTENDDDYNDDVFELLTAFRFFRTHCKWVVSGFLLLLSRLDLLIPRRLCVTNIDNLLPPPKEGRLLEILHFQEREQGKNKLFKK